MKKTFVIAGLVLLGNLIGNNAFAASGWYQDSYRGWYWFEEKPNEEEEKNNQEAMMLKDRALFAEPKSAAEAVVQLEKIQEELKAAKAYAILTKDVNHTARYISLQRRVLDISERFSGGWQEALRKYPYLDESLLHPVNGRAKEIKEKILTEEENTKIADFSKTYGLLVVTKAGCAYCEAFLPTLKEFAEKYSFSLGEMNQGARAGNTRSKNIEQINNPVLLEALDTSYIPAVFAVDASNGKVIVISHGFLSFDELKKRILLVINQQGKEG